MRQESISLRLLLEERHRPPDSSVDRSDDLQTTSIALV